MVFKDDYAVLTGIISLTNGNGQQTINYPSGYTKDNCICISSAIQYTANWSSDEYMNVVLGTNSVILNSNHSSGPTASKNYKVVLMKIS